MTLKELYDSTINCNKCMLKATCTNIVFGVGNEDADLLFVGEAPGYWEDLKGEPFVGQAGKLLDEMLVSIGLNRSDVYIANVLKCRPPNNRNPLPDEIEACKGILFKQIEIINPRVVSTLGNFSTKLILESNEGISKVHGKAFKKDGYLVFPTYHPAAALYTRATKKDLEEDFQKLKNIIKEKPKVEQMTIW